MKIIKVKLKKNHLHHLNFILNLMKKEMKKKDNIIRKGYSTFVQKLETDKQNVSQLLEKHKIEKKQVPKASIAVDTVSLNKKEKNFS